MSIATAIMLLVALIAILLFRSSHQTARLHRAFGRDDVLEALDNVLSEEIVLHDTWDMFLALPIDDPHLESLRQRCLEICANDKPEANRDLSEAGAAEVGAIRRELREAPNNSFKPNPLRGSA